MRWRWQLPDGNLGRARLGALLYAALSSFSLLGQLGNPLRSATYTLVAALSIVLFFGILAVTYFRGRTSWATLLPVPMLAVIGAAGLKDPFAEMALTLGSLTILSMYGSNRLFVARVVLAVTSVPAAVAISPNSYGREMIWTSPQFLAPLPQVALIALLTRGIYLSLARQERALARESVLARASQAMLSVIDVHQIREIGGSSAAELIELNPGVVLLILSRHTGRLRIVEVAGAPDWLVGRALGDPDVPDPAEFSLLLPDYHDWHVAPLGAKSSTQDQYIAVGARHRVPREVLDAFRTLSHQVLLGESRGHAHTDLEHRAHHDHLTELPTRAKFLRAVGRALTDDNDGVVALLNVDLDDFKQVNDGFGHAAGDELLVEVANRLTEIVQDRGMAARFGGDEFALLLTGLVDPLEAERIAERLITRLAAPIALSAATVRVGASVGVALAEPGITVAELTRHADMAMYSAKTAGKNRVEVYRYEWPFGQVMPRRHSGEHQPAA